jgi:TRAP-type mannitol/chloroaromatic compound transport system substrate-binding protein
MERRRFIVKAGGVLAAAGAAAVVEAPNVIAQPKIQWRMPTSWTPALDILMGGPKRLAEIVEQMSGGRMKIQVYAAGELIPAFGVWDAVSQGTVESYNSASYYWAGKEPATQWFTAVPFGLNGPGTAAWVHYGGGIELWEETYAPFNLVPRPSGSTGVQMGGWFRKKINTINDYKGLKMRIPGLGGKVVAQAGGTVVLTPGGEIYTALERGVIDASEWVGPYDDMKLGLHQTAKYYYYPGWHEPGTTGEFVFNRKAFESLPADLKRIVDYATVYAGQKMFFEFEARNGASLNELRTKFARRVELVQFPAGVLKALKKMSAEVNTEEAAKSTMAKKVHESYTKFQKTIGDWGKVSEAPYQNFIVG